MSQIRFICPECGHLSQYTKELAAEIAALVCGYYNLDSEKILRRWNKTDKHDGAKNLSVYFIRAMTGALYKIIGGDLGISTTRVGNMIFRVETRLEEDPGYQKEVDEIRNLIVQELSLEKKFFL